MSCEGCTLQRMRGKKRRLPKKGGEREDQQRCYPTSVSLHKSYLLVEDGQPLTDDGKLRPVVKQHRCQREEQDLQDSRERIQWRVEGQGESYGRYEVRKEMALP